MGIPTRAPPPVSSFSILVQIVGSATEQGGPTNPGNSPIFQYPRADRGECNCGAGSSLRSQLHPFSILVQIVGSATTWNDVITSAEAFLFQYPRADRGECNFDPEGLLELAESIPFSILVQIVGSATFSADGLNNVKPLPFSILVQIVGSATYYNAQQGDTVFAPFSILVQIVGSATASRVRARRISPLTFSILVQIVGSATRWG